MKETFTYQLSIIIVNYNVEHFLDQCLASVYLAQEKVKAEVIVVDNNSIDGSLKMLKEKYPEITLIANKDNSGFSKANNQGINISKGKYVLLLNPDTLVKEDTFIKVIDFMDARENAGALGIRMIDGKGQFLPESKRGLPTPFVAFYKIFGLSTIFPKSKKFGQYHLGHLSEFENNEVDIISGAFMLIRKEALDKVGLLDETFFMYGEDIDLSYRIQQGGYTNHYFAESEIIHYKGESTKKSSVNYVFVFYNAMIIFAKKHFSGKNAKLFSILIKLAIYLRAFLAILVRFIKGAFLPLIDFAYIIVGLYILTNYWKMSSIEFPIELIKYSIPLYGVTWMLSSIFNGGYDKNNKLSKLFKGVFWGTIIILLTYAILPKSWQFSRLFIFIGAGWVLTYYFMSRLFLHFAVRKQFNLNFNDKKNFGVYAVGEEFERIKNLLIQINPKIGKINSFSEAPKEAELAQFNELILCTKQSSFREIIQLIDTLKNSQLTYKIAPENSEYLIGSDSIDTAGDLYILNMNKLVNIENKRKKRLFDVLFASIIILLLPVLIFFFKNKKRVLQSLFSVAFGSKSFVGFSDETSKKDVRLPKIKTGILTPSDGLEIKTSEIIEKMNLLYARNYSMRRDFSILLKAWKKLDR